MQYGALTWWFPAKHEEQITLREFLKKYFDQGGGEGGDLASACLEKYTF
jgi:hypothetical protein